MISCVFPGSFDPVTSGHLDLVERASVLFDHVTVTVMVNIRKQGCIPIQTRIHLLQKVCSPFPNVTVDCWEGLLADYMRDKKQKILIRGIRSGQELDQELISCAANKKLYREFETLFLPANPLLQGVSSSAVREIAAFGGDISDFVPENVRKEIEEILSKK